MNCPRCQTANPAEARFCSDCGGRLLARCASCGAELGAQTRFCGQCGRSVAPAPARPRFASPRAYTPEHLVEKIALTRGALAGERKQVTVLFADLTGSIELFADRDPEDIRKILDPALEQMMEAVHQYEGTVNQVLAGGIMALFGAPLAHEDHAVRACFAALRMQEAVARYAEQVRRQEGIPLQLRIGCNSGEVVVRSIGDDLHMDYTAVGQTTHLAARMQQMARPGSTLITADTFRLAEGHVEARPLGPMPVKGLDLPVEVYETMGAGRARTRLQAAAARGLTRFVGREHELEALTGALERARAGAGQVVAVVGEPGVGKSRLVHEFAHSPRTREWLVLETAAVSYRTATAYHPVVELLRAYLHVEPGDDERAIREKAIGKLLTLDDALRSVLSALLAVLDVPIDDAQWKRLDPEQRRQRILDGLRRVLLRECLVQPVLLVMEDLHWIDTDTQALLENLVERLGRAPILLVVNYRPEYRHGWEGRANYQEFRLDTLPRESSSALLGALVGHHPGLEPLKQLLIDRTAGNPFFLEESVRTLVEARALTGERGQYRLARQVDSVQVPSTVQAVLAARIDRLPAEEKRLLQSAAVIGRDVPLAQLQALEDLPEERLRGGIARLQGAEFLYETRLFPDLLLSFKHALTHEVAYGALVHERRRELHARLVEVLEGGAGGRGSEPAATLAHHALRGELWDKAVTYFRQAASQASARSAYRESVTSLEHALTALDHLPQTRQVQEQAIDLRFDLQGGLIPLGELPRMIETLSQAERLAESLGDQGRLGRVSAYMTQCLWWTGRPDLAVESGERALAIASSLGDTALASMTRQRLGQAYTSLGQFRRAIAAFRRHADDLDAAPESRKGRIDLRALASRAWTVWALSYLGEFDEAMALAGQCMRAAEAAGHDLTVAMTYLTGALPHLFQGSFVRAIAWFEHGLEICQREHFTAVYLLIAAHLGSAYARAGRAGEGVALLEQSAERAAALRLMPSHAFNVTALGEAYWLSGRVDHALSANQRGLDLARAHKQRWLEATGCLLRGDMHAARPSDRAPAERCYRDALDTAQALGLRPLEGRCQLALGTLLRRGGDLPGAEAPLAAAVSIFRQLGMEHWLEVARAEAPHLAALHAPRPRPGRE
ncbi:MAG: AAA family ATPase [Candidatus Rokubacteria bacterium]|nr:AAA family ATPase [Candidatus Rokubacteria bacterium]